MIIKKAKEWWLKLIESEDGTPVGALIHSSNGCCNPSCEVCSGAPCHSTMCEKCSPDAFKFVLPDFLPTHLTPTTEDKLAAKLAVQITQTGFDKWLQDKLQDPVFKEEYEKAKKEIEDYDRKHREKESLEEARVPHGQMGGTPKGSKD
jgi:hypothetical protein